MRDQDRQAVEQMKQITERLRMMQSFTDKGQAEEITDEEAREAALSVLEFREECKRGYLAASKIIELLGYCNMETILPLHPAALLSLVQAYITDEIKTVKDNKGRKGKGSGSPDIRALERVEKALSSASSDLSNIYQNKLN